MPPRYCDRFSICQSVCYSQICLSVCYRFSICLSVCYIFVCLSVTDSQFVCLSVTDLSVCLLQILNLSVSLLLTDLSVCLFVVQILRQVRKLDWRDQEIFVYTVSCLSSVWNVKFNNIHCVANLLAGLKSYQVCVFVCLFVCLFAITGRFIYSETSDRGQTS